MRNSTISLKPVKDLLGMNFYIPDYQRGYRWTEQQARDLLNDIWSFANDKDTSMSEEIYCVQPLVVQQKNDSILENIKKEVGSDKEEAEVIREVIRHLKGSWNVVDGQQRLTTIFLILSALGLSTPYQIDYETRKGSAAYLASINQAQKNDNMDYYHIYNVHDAIQQWLKDKTPQDIDTFRETLLNRVHFIWYQIKSEAADHSRDEAIAAFTRLNIGKIPLTDSELVKALFLNRSNFDCSALELEKQQLKIATEWDHIEYTLQNDEFWLFLQQTNYDSPTRIDFILDLLREHDVLGLYENEKAYRNTKKNANRTNAEQHNVRIKTQIGTDEHKTFRYFYYAFSAEKKITPQWLNEKWNEIKRYFQIFTEWYNNYRLYHYIGFLTSIPEAKADIISDLVKEWKDGPEKTESSRATFLKSLKDKICATLPRDSRTNKPVDLETYTFEEGDALSKRRCVPVLLLHNIETIIQQNDKLIEDKRYSLPNFTKFPFHLYKKDHWDVEHIRPNAGVNLPDTVKPVYAHLAKKYIGHISTVAPAIDAYLQGKLGFDLMLEQILSLDNSITEQDKNKIWNYVLLDSTTNKEYSNAIFPIKRAFVANKERGFKINYKLENGSINTTDKEPKIAFVPPCTKNVFAKFYTDVPDGMLEWTREDAQNYLADIQEKLKEYMGVSSNE